MPKVAQNGPKWPKVAPTLRENLDGPEWPKILASNHSPQSSENTFFWDTLYMFINIMVVKLQMKQKSRHRIATESLLKGG